jgi:glutamine synthetase
MAKTVADVMKMVKDNEIKFVDLFTDTRGKGAARHGANFAFR